jgi:hypothetical protein
VVGPAENSLALDTAIDTEIEACGGDARAAVRALIVANNYLEAEVKRLAETVSSGFTRGFSAKRYDLFAFPDFRGGVAKWRQDIESRFPHSVDLAPPEGGFSDEVENTIVRFLTPLYGTYDLYADLQGNDPCIHYCFAQEQDAVAFHAAFAGMALKSRPKMAG